MDRRRTRTLPAWAALTAGLVLTGHAALQVEAGIEDEARRQLAALGDRIAQTTHERLSACALILKGAAGLLAGRHDVDRRQWQLYVDTLRAGGGVTGLQGIGYAKLIAPEQLATHEAAVRAEGFPDYAVRPAGPRALYTAIVYLEPFGGRSLRAFGYDMHSEPTRRAAMERARDSGEPALSGRVDLVHETGQVVQAGTLLYAPVYRQGMPTDSVDARRAALVGWSFGPQRMRDLMAGVLTGWTSHEGRAIDLHVRDGAPQAGEGLLFDSLPEGRHMGPSTLRQQRSIHFCGRQWLMEIDARGGSTAFGRTSVWVTLAGGAALSVLLWGLLLSRANTKARASAIAVDLTAELRQHEASLKESEGRFRTMADTAPVLMWMADADRRFDWVNQRWLDFTGRTAQQEAGEGWTESVHPDDRGRCLDARTAAYAARQPFALEYRLRRADGEYRWLIDHGVPRFDPQGRFTGYIGGCLDITERKQAEAELDRHRHHLEALVSLRTAELARARDRADAASQAKTIFLANMSHELRTPLNGVIGTIDVLRRRERDPDTLVWLDRGMRSARHLLAVIDDVLDISRIESDRLTLEETGFSLPQAVDEVLQLQEAALGDKNLRLARAIDPALPDRVLGDPQRVRQILMHFIGNAIKFSDHGTIHVWLRRLDAPPPEVLLRLEVTDQGVGLSADQQARLFRPFAQGDDSTTRRHGGTGLGLAIAKGLAQRMGGDVGVSSAPGAGSTFWATMRLRAAADAPADAPADDDDRARERIARDFKGAPVLLAEDDPINREVVTTLLREAGLEVVSAADGAQAVEHAACARFALILMDVQMPVMNGLDAARAIRRLPSVGAVPIVALTANAFGEDRSRCLEADMDDHIGKPVEAEVLFAVVLRWLQSAAAGAPG